MFQTVLIVVLCVRTGWGLLKHGIVQGGDQVGVEDECVAESEEENGACPESVTYLAVVGWLEACVWEEEMHVSGGIGLRIVLDDLCDHDGGCGDSSKVVSGGSSFLSWLQLLVRMCLSPC